MAGSAVAALFAVLANAGSADPQAAYQAGLERADLGRLPRPGGGVTALDKVWPVLDGLAGRHKEAVLAGMVSVLGHDGVLAVPELELLRTVCAILHCPLPPLGPDTRK